MDWIMLGKLVAELCAFEVFFAYDIRFLIK